MSSPMMNRVANRKLEAGRCRRKTPILIHQSGTSQSSGSSSSLLVAIPIVASVSKIRTPIDSFDCSPQSSDEKEISWSANEPDPKHGSAPQRVNSRSRQLRRSELIVINHDPSTYEKGNPSPGYGRAYGDENREHGSSTYMGIYPHSLSPATISRADAQLNLNASMHSLSLGGSNQRCPTNENVPVFKCVQTNIRHAENEFIAVKNKRTNEWIFKQCDQSTQPDGVVTQPNERFNPLPFLQVNGLLTLSNDLEVNSSQGISYEPGQQSDVFSDDLKSISDYAGTKATSVSIFEEIQEEVGLSNVAEEQQYIDEKCQEPLPYQKGLRTVEGPTVQQSAVNPTKNDSASTQPSQEHASSGFDQAGSSHMTGNKKRRMEGSNSNRESADDSQDDSEEDESRRLPKRNDKKKAVDSPLLACPYFKHNSRKYSGREWRGCRGPGWDTVHRMKEHLYSRHRQPKFVCKRCGEHFNEEDDLNNHSRQIEPCILQEVPSLDGFDSKQEVKLRSRKRSFTSLSEPNKWRSTYAILFPHVPEAQIPSPYYGHIGSVSDILSDYEEFMLNQMTGGFRATLEHGLETKFNLTEDGSKQQAIEWFVNTQLELLRKFQTSFEPRSLSTTLANHGPSEAYTSNSEITPLHFSQDSELPLDMSNIFPIEQIVGGGEIGVLCHEEPEYFGGFEVDDNTIPFLVEPSRNERPRPADSAYGSMGSKESN